MLKQYLLTALRSFRRNKVSALINVAGLVIGICASVVIFLIVRYDFGFDKFEPGVDRLYRVVTDMRMNGESYPNGGVPGVLPDAIRTDLTGVETVTTFYEHDATVLPAKAARPFKGQTDIVFADAHYFPMFGYRWLAGDPHQDLKAPGQVILTESRARVYFPGLTPEQVLGKTIVYDDTVHTAVTGVVADLTQNTDLHYKEFISYPTLTGQLKNIWSHEWNSVYGTQRCFVRLSPGMTKVQVDKGLARIRARYADDTSSVYSLQPMNDLHFNATYYPLGARTANKAALFGLLAAGLFLLLLACINYINLTTAQAGQRAKEIGIRKTMGSTRWQLVRRFLGETLVLTLLATVIGAALTPTLLKIFADFTPEGIVFHPFAAPGVLAFLAALTVVVSLMAGFYPAWVLAGLKPIAVLKNQMGATKSRKAWLRKTLTVFQFVIAQVFVLGTLLVSKQVYYALHKDLGYRKDAIVFVNLPWNVYAAADHRNHTLLNKVNTLPGVEYASLGGMPPASDNYNAMGITYKEGPQEIKIQPEFREGDTNYIRVYGLRLLAGQNLPSSDTPREYLINQTLARTLGFRDPHQALGHHVLDGEDHSHLIVGVVSDFYQTSLRSPIKPLMIHGGDNNSYTLHLSLQKGADWTKTIAGIKAAYKTLYPDDDFDYTFFDKSIAAMYTTEQNTARLLAWATGLSIVISCLGLLGLVLFTTRQRTKEIGVRKVLGASVARIVALLSSDFLKLVALAFVIAVPLSYWGIHVWLDNFADRTTISWWVFAAGGGIILLMALFTLSFQTIRAAKANPVKSLRSE
ncbi:FtsX-like permease family protein [Dinghuibacter silviterrae]|uniref:Putative permease n=1 Tax=Dinghuibacter silviterrae TaxID=1539049 RepID=A0A4R8DTX1_9BACT|nr:FtsX-like permease family protein [Dinghuibacter silviterrae]TDX01579.1 putative permease [Dinghuibacter silviterrae]